jgi:dihydroxyacid dehydratase/phosphogluconate dehydratase
MTRAAFENAMVMVMATGGSTNAVMHLIAMAKAIGVPLTIDDFQKVLERLVCVCMNINVCVCVYVCVYRVCVYMHLIAMVKAIGAPLTIDDFQKVLERFLCVCI